MCVPVFFFSSRRRHTRFDCDWSSDVCSSDLVVVRSGTADLGQWITEHRDLREDFKKIYGEEPDNPGAVSLARSEEHTSELQSQSNLVCRLLLEKKKIKIITSAGCYGRRHVPG